MASPTISQGPYYVGVDVGTGSVRAALVSRRGQGSEGRGDRVVVTANRPVHILEPQADFYEQSSDDIWEACCTAVKMVVTGINTTEIHGIGFDATCSLVALNKECQPVSVSPTGEDHWNVIMWLDHRAIDQANIINATKHKMLKYVGGIISPEMQMPKLLWLKQNRETKLWRNAGHFFDLPDFLTWKSTGSFSRSLCSLVCKWNYDASSEGGQGWNQSFLDEIGLEMLAENNYSKIGTDVLPPGTPSGGGLTAAAAAELGLVEGTAVATSMIDAHAGALGCLACTSSRPETSLPVTSKLALICGTSTCHLAVSSSPIFVPGVWGPYYSALLPGLCLNEGGQSTTGKLLDHIIEDHPMYSWLRTEADNRSDHIHTILDEVLERERKDRGLSSVGLLTQDLHMWPDFHGNRSPLADPSLKGMVSGLTMESSVESLALLYLATIQALAYGTRHIVESMQREGHSIMCLFATGGLCKNKQFVQAHADIAGLPVVLPDEQESVLLGSAILAACASRDFLNLEDAVSQMGGPGQVLEPNTHMTRYHDLKYEVYMKMLDHQRLYKKIMSDL